MKKREPLPPINRQVYPNLELLPTPFALRQKTSLPLRTLTRGIRQDLRMLGLRTYLNMTQHNVCFVCLSVNEYLLCLLACSPPLHR